MLFYDCATAPSPRRARMFIHEKGLTIETRQIDLTTKEQLSPAFLAVNPMATVPVLVTDEGEAISENAGIAAYLEAVCPEPPLLGTSPVEKARVQMWNAIVEHQGAMPIAEALRNGNPAMKGRALTGQADVAQIPELAERGLQRTARFFDLLNRRLSDSPYLAGDNFSYADITAFVMVDFARVIKMRLSEDHPAAQDWHARVKARPSAVA